MNVNARLGNIPSIWYVPVPVVWVVAAPQPTESLAEIFMRAAVTAAGTYLATQILKELF